MKALMTRTWWSLALRGVAALIFGIAAWLWPGLTLYTLILLFGLFAIADGLFSIAVAALGLADEDRRLPLVTGIAGIVVGVVAIAWPDITAMALLYLIAVWAVITGSVTILAAIALRRELEGEWIYALIGLICVLFGVAMGSIPAAGALALAWLIGAFAVFYGVLSLILALRLRERRRVIATATNVEA